MGLLSQLLLLPLAPVRGVLWITEQVAEEAERMLAAQQDPRRLLRELAAAHDRGELTDEEYAAAEDEVLAALAASTTYVIGGGHATEHATGQRADEERGG